MPTRSEVEHELIAARLEVVDAEDHNDSDGAELARMRCDALLDRWMHLAEQRA
jgi:hypothetical protein